jgi:hypothetical protein
MSAANPILIGTAVARSRSPSGERLRLPAISFRDAPRFGASLPAHAFR